MILAWLFEVMHEFGDAAAIVCDDRALSYRELLERIRSVGNRLDAAGIARGRVVALQGDFSPTSVALLLALLERGAVVVPLTESVLTQWEEFHEIAEVEVVARVDSDDDWHCEHRDLEETRNPLTRQLLDEGRPGLVLFTSGSTGTSKAALHDVTALLEKFKVRRDRLVTMTFLLLDHIGGFNTLLYALSNGGTVVSVSKRDPDSVCAAIERHGVELLPTTPTFLNLLLMSEAYARYDLSSLKKISYGTEVMPAATLSRMREALPSVNLVQTYGLTELGILRSKSKTPDSLYVKVGGEGFETKVVDGLLFIRARSAMLGYLNAPSPFDGEGWFNTQDSVEVDGEYLRILGRESDIINVGGQKVYPAEVESVLLEIGNVRDAAVYGEPNPITGQVVAARLNLFAPEDLASLKQRVRALCRERLAQYKVPVRIELAGYNQYSERYKKMRSGEWPGQGGT